LNNIFIYLISYLHKQFPRLGESVQLEGQQMLNPKLDFKCWCHNNTTRNCMISSIQWNKSLTSG